MMYVLGLTALTPPGVFWGGGGQPRRERKTPTLQVAKNTGKTAFCVFFPESLKPRIDIIRFNRYDLSQSGSLVSLMFHRGSLMFAKSFVVRSLKGKALGVIIRLGRLSVVHWSSGERMTFYGPASLIFSGLVLEISKTGEILTALQTKYAGLSEIVKPADSPKFKAAAYSCEFDDGSPFGAKECCVLA